jgi:hypothetical protein
MKLTESTMNVLKNFSTINENIVFEPGLEIKTISEAKNIIGKATIDNEFSSEFGIYQLPEFLNTLALCDEPTLDFEKDFVSIGDNAGVSRAKFFFSNPEVLTRPTKDIVMPSADVSFTLTAETLAKVKRAASVLGHTEVTVSVINDVLCLTVVDSANDTSNTFSVDVVGEYTSANFKFIWSIDNLRIIPGDYKVELSSKLISHFANQQHPIEYWIALEKNSKYGD